MTETEFSALFSGIFDRCGLKRFATEENIAGFHTLYELLIRFNQTTNITAITQPEEVILKHFADSVMIEEMLPAGSTLLDVGCGGGFPALPLAIVRKDLRITALDSTAKKLEFVKSVSGQLALAVNTLSGRAEELGKIPSYREQFDVVTARAVAPMPVLAEWCLPFVKVGGRFVAMKGQNGEEELKNARNALSLLGGETEMIRTAMLGDAVRVNIAVSKIRHTAPLYPRNNGAIKKKPL